jgi:hypothetical protein
MLSQFQVDTELLMANVLIDEVSLLFRTPDELDAWTYWASELKGLDHFNSVEDVCTSVANVEESYGVRFEFFKLPGLDWRIEAMCITGGTAPLHRIHLERYGTANVIHASYKLPTIGSYRQNEAEMARYAPGLTKIVEYANSYGLYTYYGGSDIDRYYLKPRVNLRDLQDHPT